jgi:cation diffusion facilitator CzcD-associated flavoprotein CzcO
MGNHHEYLVIGAGPAGVQAGYYMQRHGRDYLVLEAGPRPGTFYETYPRHRMMISINKIHTGSDDPEFNLRHDWNSLLSEGEGPLFREHSTDFFPGADALLSYLQAFVARHGIRVRHDTRVTRISRRGARFAVESADGARFTCDRLVMATGVSRPYIPAIPGIELAEGYEDVSVDPADFANQRVLILGKGNSAFETANHLAGAAALIHIVSPHSIRMAWKTHYVGDLRAVNNDFLDTYQLKSQNAAMDATVEKIVRGPDGRYLATFAYAHAEGEVEELPYDRVIRCTGFRFDASIFDADAAPALAVHDRFPALTCEWESVNQPGMFFAGTIMQGLAYRKATSGFIHGFRYNIRTLAHILGTRFHGEPWPADTLPFEVDAVAGRVLQRVNRASDIWQQQSFLGDAVLVRDDGTVEWRESLPVAYIREKFAAAGRRVFMLTLEFGPDDGKHDPFNTPRVRKDNVPRAADSRFLHPIVREFQDGEQVAEHHIIEHLEARWEASEHVQPLLAWLRQRIGAPGVPVVRIASAEDADALQPAGD